MKTAEGGGGISTRTRKRPRLAASSCLFPHVFFPNTTRHLTARPPTPLRGARATNEQVDVWLLLQHHLLFDEEIGSHGVLLRSLLQPHFRAAAATGCRLPTSTKGNGARRGSASPTASRSARCARARLACNESIFAEISEQIRRPCSSSSAVRKQAGR